MILQDPTTPVAAGATAGGAVDWLYATVMGLVEGLTEFLPVSSTGHLIVTSRIFQRGGNPGFEIGIQVGAITAILFLYWPKVFGAVRQLLGKPVADDGRPVQQTNLLWLLVVAATPAAILGLLWKDHITDLLFNNITVGVALVLGGVALLVLEAWEKKRGMAEETALTTEAMTIKQALQIGLFQTLALIPGVSRSGSVIAGAMVIGFRRTACAEFSFLVGLPILYGAALVKVAGSPQLFSDSRLMTEFVVATVAAFLSAMVVVAPFVRFLQRHTFVPFGWYRIIAGSILLVLVQTGCLSGT